MIANEIINGRGGNIGNFETLQIARWWLQLQEYSISIEYHPGSKLSHADALSRNSGNIVQPPEEINIFQIEPED